MGRETEHLGRAEPCSVLRGFRVSPGTVSALNPVGPEAGVRKGGPQSLALTGRSLTEAGTPGHHQRVQASAPGVSETAAGVYSPKHGTSQLAQPPSANCGPHLSSTVPQNVLTHEVSAVVGGTTGPLAPSRLVQGREAARGTHGAAPAHGEGSEDLGKRVLRKLCYHSTQHFHS